MTFQVTLEMKIAPIGQKIKSSLMILSCNFNSLTGFQKNMPD